MNPVTALNGVKIHNTPKAQGVKKNVAFYDMYMHYFNSVIFFFSNQINFIRPN